MKFSSNLEQIQTPSAGLRRGRSAIGSLSCEGFPQTVTLTCRAVHQDPSQATGNESQAHAGARRTPNLGSEERAVSKPHSVESDCERCKNPEHYTTDSIAAARGLTRKSHKRALNHRSHPGTKRERNSGVTSRKKADFKFQPGPHFLPNYSLARRGARLCRAFGVGRGESQRVTQQGMSAKVEKEEVYSLRSLDKAQGLQASTQQRPQTQLLPERERQTKSKVLRAVEWASTSPTFSSYATDKQEASWPALLRSSACFVFFGRCSHPYHPPLLKKCK